MKYEAVNNSNRNIGRAIKIRDFIVTYIFKRAFKVLID